MHFKEEREKYPKKEEEREKKIKITKGVKKTFTKGKNNVAHAGLEPATFALLARRSNQLS
jgi:hypothetical protein